MTKTIHFNTGRLYTKNGQRITATLHDDGGVTFFDHDRMIDGEIHVIDPVDFDHLAVLHAYDNGIYDRSTRSWTDGMISGGCNARYEG